MFSTAPADWASLNVKKVLFQAIQFSMGTEFSSIQPIENTLLDATNPDLSGPGTDGNKGVVHIP